VDGFRPMLVLITSDGKLRGHHVTSTASPAGLDTQLISYFYQLVRDSSDVEFLTLITVIVIVLVIIECLCITHMSCQACEPLCSTQLRSR
jgi:hypothetical protein